MNNGTSQIPFLPQTTTRTTAIIPFFCSRRSPKMSPSSPKTNCEEGQSGICGYLLSLNSETWRELPWVAPTTSPSPIGVREGLVGMGLTPPHLASGTLGTATVNNIWKSWTRKWTLLETGRGSDPTHQPWRFQDYRSVLPFEFAKNSNCFPAQRKTKAWRILTFFLNSKRRPQEPTNQQVLSDHRGLWGVFRPTHGGRARICLPAHPLGRHCSWMFRQGSTPAAAPQLGQKACGETSRGQSCFLSTLLILCFAFL